MATTVKQWEEAWNRLVKAREKLESFERSYAIVRHILILDNIKPGDTISLDYAFGEQAPSAEVLKALENSIRLCAGKIAYFGNSGSPLLMPS